jgi:hypothetical protein
MNPDQQSESRYVHVLIDAERLLALSDLSALTGRSVEELLGTVAGRLENESTVDHPGNAVVKTLTFGLDAWEPHEREADYTYQIIKA